MARRGEWLAAACWAAFGTAVLVGSWQMDRLGHQGISPWSAPGLLPGVVGALMIVFAAALALQSARAAPPATAAEPAGGEDASHHGLKTSALAALLCLAFAGLALGHGWPFEVEAALFITAFTTVFSWATWRREGRVARGFAVAVVTALVAAVAISALFERVFLVRLP